MTLSKLLTYRRFQQKFHLAIVYEWEDQIASSLNLSFVNNPIAIRGVDVVTRYFSKMPLPCPTVNNALSFVVQPDSWDRNIAGKRNVIPAMIDFWYRDPESLAYFNKRYCHNPAVLMSSREAFELVRDKCLDVKAFHWGLSVADKYVREDIGDDFFSRKYDCVVVGRPNPVLNDWLFQYISCHGKFTCVFNTRTKEHSNWYETSSGEVLGDILHTREDYMRLLSSARVSLYSTPGIDDSRYRSNGFNQVTPRFLECLACGCHVMARYKENADTDFYELPSIAPHVETYEMFERMMDYAICHNVDRALYRNYLDKHKTSKRIEQLKQILEKV